MNTCKKGKSKTENFTLGKAHLKEKNLEEEAITKTHTTNSHPASLSLLEPHNPHWTDTVLAMPICLLLDELSGPPPLTLTLKSLFASTYRPKMCPSASHLDVETGGTTTSPLLNLSVPPSPPPPHTTKPQLPTVEKPDSPTLYQSLS